MRHLNSKQTLNRNASHRRALLMNLANSLFEHERITTTTPKAMELKRVAERLITLAKRKDLHSMRLVFAFLRNKDVVRKLFRDIGERFTAINGGYTRVLKVGRRKGDAAPMAFIELTIKGEKEEKKEEKEKKARAKKAKKEAKKETKKETAPKKERKGKGQFIGKEA
jgi:large subunit ribosomal protein L17